MRLAVMTSRFQGIARAMMNTLERTGRSGVLNRARDFSCCVLTADCELLTAAESLPIHVLSGPDLMAQWMLRLHRPLRRGDAFLHNSPYHGNTHAADHSILIPVVDDVGNHRYTVLAKAHQADCGDSLPTTYHGTARDVYEEGALIFPCTRVQSDYVDCEDIIRLCKMRIRVPEQWWGDYLATLGAARIGERKILELGQELGWETLDEYARDWFDYSEERMADGIRQLPAGRVIVTTCHDPVPGLPSGVDLSVTLEIDPAEAQITIDLRNNPDCQPCGLNLSEATSGTAAMIGVFNSIDHTIPPNAGSFRRITVQLRDNCVVGIPKHPTSCSVATTNIADRVSSAVQRAFAEWGEGIGMAEAGPGGQPAVAVISGRDPRANDSPFVNELFLATTAGAASPRADGWLTLGSVGAGGMLLIDSVELDELEHPILVRSQRIIPDSEGAGRCRGAPGAYVEYESRGCSIELMYLSDGGNTPARGARGGLSGATARQFKLGRSGDEIEIDAFQTKLQPSEAVVSISTGGGGYGSPLERLASKVTHDVNEGWITRDRAYSVYGVVVGEDGLLDEEATAGLRRRRWS